MEDGDAILYLQLRTIPATTTQEALARVLETLWSTRSTGVGPLQKPGLQSLLNLPSLQELDPVLACLRSIIRKTVHQELSGDDIRKLFPAGLPVGLQDILSGLLLRYQHEWKEEALRDQHSRVPSQAHVNAPPTFTPLPASEASLSMWPQKDDATRWYNKRSSGPTSAMDSNPPSTTSVPVHPDSGSLDGLVILPGLKSMTWSMENRSSAPVNRVAIISLKLQDNTKSSSGEVEVKFQLSRDTLEAMLRSMTYISEKISDSVVAASEPVAKKQRQ
ncbi:hypothetical protein Taro_037392 [Colocasia esculenta]|uniref:COMM domain-containing protein n=1 Tax=Colocasia esculenta TaxID=4460 RepID=A0A843W5K2_COLES|nr:hypothetical protein [Colocasia esculenta]